MAVAHGLTVQRVADGQADGGRIEVAVNGRAIRVWPWGRWRDAVALWSPDAGRALARDEGWLADRRGEPLDADGRVVAGASIEYRAGRGEGGA